MTEIQLTLPADRLDAWGDALLEAGALSVVVEDADGDTLDEVAVYGEPGLAPAAPGWRNNRVSVLFDDALGAAALLAAAAAAMDSEIPAVLLQRPVEDRDWVRQTQAQFAPIRIGRMWIVPSWHEPPDPQACNVRLDPGVAFGTGTHPTTRLCLAWIERHLLPGARVLDYGCGSGILSICAARLGAGTVRGVDIDALALPTARENASRNGVSVLYTSPDDLAHDAPAPFDLVVANILANPIMLLAPTLLRHLAPGGTLLLSGILERQAAAVIGAFDAAAAEAGFAVPLAVAGREEAWVAIAGARQV